MIILHRQRVIFLKPHKVAGTSFEIALSKYAQAGDVITPITSQDEDTRKLLGYPGPQNHTKSLGDFLRRPKVKDIKRWLRGKRLYNFINHVPAAEVKRLVGKEVWNSYLKVSIVRNPWDRIVSEYFWEKKRTDSKSKAIPQTFGEWCARDKRDFDTNNSLYMIGGEVVVDHFIRYEHLEEDIRALETRLPALAGLYEVFAAISAKGGLRPRSATSADEMFSGLCEIDAMVRRACRYEIERFGYTRAKALPSLPVVRDDNSAM